MYWWLVLIACGASFCAYRFGWYVGHNRGWNDCAGLMTCLPKSPKNRLEDQNWQLN